MKLSKMKNKMPVLWVSFNSGGRLKFVFILWFALTLDHCTHWPSLANASTNYSIIEIIVFNAKIHTILFPFIIICQSIWLWWLFFSSDFRFALVQICLFSCFYFFLFQWVTLYYSTNLFINPIKTFISYSTHPLSAFQFV